MGERVLFCQVTSVTEALLAEKAGVEAIMVCNTNSQLDIRLLQDIKNQFPSFPLIARIRRGHFIEAQLCKELGITMIDESDEYKVDESYIQKPVDNDHHQTFMNGCFKETT